MSNTYKELTRNDSIIQKNCFAIENLAKAFERTGNFMVSEELYEQAKQISQSSKAMVNAYNKETRKAFDDMNVQIGKTLSACLHHSEEQ